MPFSASNCSLSALARALQYTVRAMERTVYMQVETTDKINVLYQFGKSICGGSVWYCSMSAWAIILYKYSFFSLGKKLNKCIITNIAVVDFIKSRILLDLASLHLGVKKSCVFGGLLLDEIIGLSPIILFCHFTATCCQYKSAVIIKWKCLLLNNNLLWLYQ